MPLKLQMKTHSSFIHFLKHHLTIMDDYSNGKDNLLMKTQSFIDNPSTEGQWALNLYINLCPCPE